MSGCLDRCALALAALLLLLAGCWGTRDATTPSQRSGQPSGAGADDPGWWLAFASEWASAAAAFAIFAAIIVCIFLPSSRKWALRVIIAAGAILLIAPFLITVSGWLKIASWIVGILACILGGFYLWRHHRHDFEDAVGWDLDRDGTIGAPVSAEPQA